MKVLVQWMLKTPTDWIEIDSSQWASLPELKEPTGNQTGDNNTKPGWIHDLCIQGLSFGGFDHHALEDLNDGSGGVKVTAWNDDPDDYPDGEKYASLWTILPLAANPDFGGAINTRQSQVVYGQANVLARLGLPAINAVHRPWSEFVPPPESVTRHGIWVSDSLFDAHVSALTPRGWREWGEHLNPSELDASGRVKVQRDLGRYKKPLGTITYYQRDTDRATGVHAAQDSNRENALELSTAAVVGESVSTPKNATIIGWVFTTPSDEPNKSDWPDGTYNCQLDVSGANSNLYYGLVTTEGHFGRVNAGLTSDLETVGQAESEFNGAGLKLATASWNPSAGAAGDRFEVVVRIRNANTHSARSMSLELNTADSYADGPWT
ncbi:MAG: hypothetical protein V3S68_06185, partial [Dehalococcoidia bacterium]